MSALLNGRSPAKALPPTDHVRQPDQVLFAWRWPSAGHHTITIRPGIPDAAEGGSYFQMDGYLVVG